MAASAARRTPSASGLTDNVRTAIEWLLLALIPFVALIQLPEGFMLGYIQVAKVSVFRTIAIALAGLWALEWALTSGRAPLRTPGEYARGAWGWLRGGPTRVMMGSALALTVVVGLSAALSPLPRLGFWGYDPGWDTYGLYSIACYAAIFLAAATHLRTRQQVWRLMVIIAATGTLSSVYGIGQHFGYDPLRAPGADSTRASLTLGNPVFAGSVLAMTIPITLALIVEGLERSRTIARVALWWLPLMLQATALLFTLSRGPWVATAAGMMVFLLAAWRLRGWKTAAWSVGLLAAAVAAGWLLTIPPAAGVKAGGDTTVAGRVGTIATEATVGTLSNRFIIWQTTGQALAEGVSFDTEAYPELPEVSLPALRPIIGYGPDTFVTFYQLVGDTRATKTLIEHGHNFLVHTALELGVIGVLVYLSLAASAALVLWRLLRLGAGGRLESWLAWIAVALAGVFGARVVEQMVGKAQITDFVMVWVLLGVLIAAGRLSGERAEKVAGTAEATSAGAPDAGRLSGEGAAAEPATPDAAEAPDADAETGGRKERSHYEALGLSPQATREEIRRARRAVGGGGGKREAEAYQVLMDPRRRRAYDQTLGLRTPSAAGNRQQRRAERRRAARESTAAQASAWRVGAASVLCVLLVVVWWSATLSPLMAARISGQAIDAFEQGRVQQGISELERAIDWHPRQALLHIQLSDALRGLADGQGEPAQVAEGLRRAQAAVEGAREWNAADHRVWTRLSDMSRAVAGLTGENADQALHYAKIMTVLLPGFAQPSLALSWTYLQAGQFDAALAQSETALALAGDEAANAAQVWFVRGMALAELDRRDEAVVALRRSVELQPNQQAQDALAAMEAEDAEAAGP